MNITCVYLAGLKKKSVILVCIDFVPNRDQYLHSAAWLTPAQHSGCLRHGYLFQLTGAQGSRDREAKKRKEIEQRVKRQRTERHWEKDSEISLTSDTKFTHLRIIHPKGSLTEKLDRELCQPATKVWSDTALSVPVPVVAPSLLQSTSRPSERQIVKSACVWMQRN